MRGTVAFLELITAFCRMLDTIPPDQAFGQLTIDLLTSYYEKCNEWYKELVARPDSNVAETTKASARWARTDPIRSAISEVWKLDDDASPAEALKEVCIHLCLCD